MREFELRRLRIAAKKPIAAIFLKDFEVREPTPEENLITTAAVQRDRTIVLNKGFMSSLSDDELIGLFWYEYFTWWRLWGKEQAFQANVRLWRPARDLKLK